MTRLRPITSYCCSPLAIAAALLAAPPVRAQDCTQDSDCAPFQVCETFEYELCGRPACAPGEMCEPDPGSCMSYESSSCVAAPCASDADCPADTVCHASTYTECSVSACPRDEMCPDVEPDCVERTGESVCTPRYALPCSADADCGPGFRCEEQQSWWCDGGGASMGPEPIPAPGAEAQPPVPMDPGAMQPPQDPGEPDPDFECHVEPTGTFACVLQELPCSSDSECPEGLECTASYTSGGCWADSEGNMGCEEPMVGPSSCQPPGYGGGTAPPVSMPGSGAPTGPGGGTGNGPVDGGTAGPGTPMPGSNPGAPNGNPPPTSGESDDDEDHGELPQWKHRGFGCSTGTTTPADWMGFAGLIGLALARIRARNRA